MTHEYLINLIKKAAAARGLSEATLCRLAVGNNRLFKNLSQGKSCTLAVALRLDEYIAASAPTKGGAE